MTAAAQSHGKRKVGARWPGVLGACLLVLFLPLALASVICYLLFGLLLLVIIWCWWCPRGKKALFVHSNSPLWQEYVAEQILPQLGKRAVLLNWSERSRWRLNFAVLVFWYFGGSREFNPLGVVFRPLRLPRVFRFREPFRDFKHGNRIAVEKMTSEFLECAA
jgi:hypothetical protein